MKKALLIMLGLFLCTSSINVHADLSGLIRKRCTCYLDRGVTASGHYTRHGIIAGRRADLGKVAAIYECDSDGNVGGFIGYYEFLDTGAGIDTDGDGKGDSLKKGLSIDVYQDSMHEAREWIKEHGDYVYIKYIEADG